MTFTIEVELLLDIVLCIGIFSLAFLSLSTSNIFKAVLFFICMGLLVTIAWARLKAWDVAIAEAAIGAGITGVLLLVTIARPRIKTLSEEASNHVS